uniref:Uncharacterized protein n=1 Tax=Anguilla anguilla TaxID=7936 RepID=A0A0E9VQS4_ANGAN
MKAGSVFEEKLHRPEATAPLQHITNDTGSGERDPWTFL